MHVTTDRWTASTAFPAENEVRVWEIDLEVPPFPVSELLGHMTLEERARAERFRVARAYHQFVTTRGLLRLMLGRYFGMPPADVPITYSGVGKPVVAGLPASPHFNVSHTDGLALIAFAHRPVGVDVERIRVMDDPEGLVARFFSQAESERYRSLDPGRQPAGFFRGWTSKEAVLKAAGLSVGFLDEFDVELDPDRPAALLAARHAGLRDREWELATWTPASGFAAAVAVEGVREVTTKIKY